MTSILQIVIRNMKRKNVATSEEVVSFGFALFMIQWGLNPGRKCCEMFPKKAYPPRGIIAGKLKYILILTHPPTVGARFVFCFNTAIQSFSLLSHWFAIQLFLSSLKVNLGCADDDDWLRLCIALNFEHLQPTLSIYQLFLHWSLKQKQLRKQTQVH